MFIMQRYIHSPTIEYSGGMNWLECCSAITAALILAINLPNMYVLDTSEDN